jgi:hypothetical protein
MASFPEAMRPATAAVSDLSPYDAMGLAELIRTKQITPREAVEDAIRKTEAVNPALNAVINKTYDKARLRASELAGDGAFSGVPLLVKDNATIAGIQITRGSRALRGNVPDRTAPFFAALERTGFVLVGVTNMPEMGLIDGTENVLYGPTHNPWNLAYSPGGSSGSPGTVAGLTSVDGGRVAQSSSLGGDGAWRGKSFMCSLRAFRAARWATPCSQPPTDSTLRIVADLRASIRNVA